MKTPRLYLFILLLLLPLISSCESENVKKYYRADCIVRIDINHVATSEVELIRLNNRLLKHIQLVRQNLSPSETSFAFTSSDDDGKLKVFLQFLDNCEKRLELSKTMLKRTNENFDNELNYTVSDERIIPSPQTIDVDGAWIDESQYKLFK